MSKNYNTRKIKTRKTALKSLEKLLKIQSMSVKMAI